MLSFSVQTLSLSQIRAIYRERMRDDFPPDELKPLVTIERALARNEYVCYGAAEGEDVLAYAYFVKLKEDGQQAALLAAANARIDTQKASFDGYGPAPYALFDYFAVRRELRGREVGSWFLQALIAGPLRGMECVLLEVDDPACASTPEEAEKRTRRLAFYLRNGLKDANVKTTVYGVQYKILTLPVGRQVSREEVKRRYAALYRSILPERLFEAHVFIHGDD